MSESQGIVGQSPQAILDSLSHGVYVTDTNRRIVYWSRSAQAITGWSKEDIVGKCCYDDILCHADKDGHRLCGEEYCPLHRAILTNQSSDVPIIVFAQAKDGRRIPVHVSVAPITDASGQVVGGVEVFRDLSGEFHDFEKARKIQAKALSLDLSEDGRVKIAARCLPKDIVGGDCYRFTRLDDNQYGFFLADVSGHGVAAALYTMFLLSLWDSSRHLLVSPSRFAQATNRRLCEFVSGGAFATAVCGLLNLRRGSLTLACAGGPLPLLVRDGQFQPIGGPGAPWGFDESSAYEDVRVDVCSGDRVLLFSDGATEIRTIGDGQVDTEGLVSVLGQLNYPATPLDFQALEAQLLARSNRIRFDDDVTFLEIGLS